MQKGIVFHEGQRYLQSKRDGYILPYTKALASNRDWEEYIVPKEDPEDPYKGTVADDGVSKVVVDHIADLNKKFEGMTKRQILKFAKLEKTKTQINVTSKPAIIEEAIRVLLGGE